MNWTRICVPYTASKHHARRSSNATLAYTPHRFNVTTAAAAAVATLLFAVAVAMSATLAPRPAQAQTMPNPAVCDRTPQIRDAIVAALDGVTSCTGVTSAHLLSIRILDASRTGLTALNADDLDGMTGLVTLSLQNNLLTRLPAGIFDGLTDLEYLNIYANQITSLPSGIFDSLTELQVLGMWSNEITSLPTNIFSQLTKLESLDIEINKIQSFDANTFQGLTKLRTLLIGHNSITNLPGNIFEDTDDLTHLYIDNTRITSLNEDTFDGLSKLERLQLDDNRLLTLPNDIFQGLISLETLWLSGNSTMTSIPADVFDGLTALKDLRMEGLSTTLSYPDGLLVGLENLEIFHAGVDGLFTPNFQVDLVRTPGSNTEAKLTVPVGAPLDMTFVVFATGNSPGYAGITVVDRATITTGSTDSGVFELPAIVDLSLRNFLNNDGTPVVFALLLNFPRPEAEVCGPEFDQVVCYKGFGFSNGIDAPVSIDTELIDINSYRMTVEMPDVLSGYRVYYGIWESGESDELIFSGIYEPTSPGLNAIELRDLTPDTQYYAVVWGLRNGFLSMYHNPVGGYLSFLGALFTTPDQPPLDSPSITPTYNVVTVTWKPAASLQALFADDASVRGFVSYQIRFKKSAESTWSEWEDAETESTEDGNLTTPLYRLEGGVTYDVELRRTFTGHTTYGIPRRVHTAPVSRTIFTFIPIPAVNRIEPSTLEVSVRAGDRVRLSADVYDSQDQLANEHADNGEGGFERWQPDLEWSSDSGGSFEDSSNGRSTVYTAPTLPGVYTVTAEVGPPGLCRAHHPGVETQDGDPCTARFTVRVSREASPATPAPTPVNPSFAIPTTVSDDAGTKFSVFTPVAGGTFSGTGITISAGPGAVPDRAALAVAAAETDAASPSETANAEFILHGKTYDVVAMSRTDDTSWSAAAQYRLDAPLTACLTVPWESANRLSSITVVEIMSDGLVGPLTSNLRSVDGGTAACGTLSRVPATLALATRADPVMEPTAAPTAAATPRELPAAGGASLTVNTLALVLLSGLVVVAVAVASAVAMKARRPARTRATE